MNRDTIRSAFEQFLRAHKLRLTPQRRAIFERAFDTHQHFTADTLFGWLKDAPSRVSRATVYRTLSLLVEGGFLESLDTGQGELRYEHVLGHRHHDHMVCLDCGRIEEFVDPRIEALQEEACRERGFVMLSHNLRLFGRCRACAKRRAHAEGDGKRTGLDEGDGKGRAHSEGDGREAGAGLRAARERT